MQLKDGQTIRNRGLYMKKILRFLKNILFPKIYMPWEDPINGSNLTHDAIERMKAEGMTNTQIYKRLGIAKSTYYLKLREYNQNL